MLPLHLSCANGQRVWKRHPFGGSIGEGTSPLNGICVFSCVGSGTGIADNNAFVYWMLWVIKDR